ncbi:CaiB/BaiF CoA transferase family protein [Rhizorhabdus phycosphaerae]|uniref:CaiB/BaiF CoA transferase family protein n=1 Tax=Rhizorhabdus phycosphaerae TaxID=2711156 RepID=UPI0013E9A369|nr:CaiB/BaiF CoA-transferase family protein [Rhizorhabdus phycosphaerae]
MTGPLAGIRVVEFAGLGPTPFVCMMLADMGAEVLRIDRRGAQAFGGGDERFNYLNRSRPSIELDLKSPEDLDLALGLAAKADVLVEGFRPGAMERLDLGPDRLTKLNDRLIYARMTGWGQTGPMAHEAGHDINYLSLTGALYLMGPHDGPPVPPINLAANFGGGGMMMLSGILAALVERSTSDRGQVVDAAMLDGASLLMTQIFAWSRMGRWHAGRGGNVLDGSAYFYRCYETSDGQYIAAGALEPQFHAAFIGGLGFDIAEFGDHLDPTLWAERAARIEPVIRSRTRDEWVAHFKGRDACVTPVLSPDEALEHPANIERQVHVAVDGALQPAPAPRLSRTPAAISAPPCLPGEGGQARLEAWGIGRNHMNGIAKAS